MLVQHSRLKDAQQTEGCTADGGRQENILPCGALQLTVHGVPIVGQQLRQRPEGVFLVHVHQQQGGDLTHALAVAHLLQETENTKKNMFHSCRAWSGSGSGSGSASGQLAEIKSTVRFSTEYKDVVSVFCSQSETLNCKLIQIQWSACQQLLINRAEHEMFAAQNTFFLFCRVSRLLGKTCTHFTSKMITGSAGRRAATYSVINWICREDVEERLLPEEERAEGENQRSNINTSITVINKPQILS